jgi:hypothetical protein
MTFPGNHTLLTSVCLPTQTLTAWDRVMSITKPTSNDIHRLLRAAVLQLDRVGMGTFSNEVAARIHTLLGRYEDAALLGVAAVPLLIERRAGHGCARGCIAIGD